MGEPTRGNQEVDKENWADQGWEIALNDENKSDSRTATGKDSAEDTAELGSLPSSDERGHAAKQDQEEEQKEDHKSSLSDNRSRAKCGAWVVGVGIMIGIVFGLIALVDFMQENGVVFRGGTENTPYTVSQVELHNSVADCWVVYHGKVYDMTNYARKHPGGANLITDGCGTDDTVAYEISHDAALLKLVKADIVGRLSEEAGGGDDVLDPTIPSDDDGDDMIDSCPTGDCISLDEVALHSSTSDCWVVYHKNVYDMTVYAPQHEGGEELITNGCGTDQTSLFTRFHKEDELRHVKEYLVGPIFTILPDESTLTPTDSPTRSPVESPIAFPTDSPIQSPGESPVEAPVESPVGPVCPTENCVTTQELVLHDNEDDCWVAYLGNVYDMTAYIPEHKGGPLFITQACGTDDTDAFLVIHKEKELKKVEDHLLGTYIEVPGIDDPHVSDQPSLAPVEAPVQGFLPTSSPTGPPSDAPAFVPDCPTENCVTSRELALHDHEEDCWVAYLGDVYDMTAYIPKHKGGPVFIISACGRDDTDAFLVIHKEKELKKVEDELIGTYLIVPGDGTSTDNPTTAPVDAPTRTPTSAPIVSPTESPTRAPVVPPTERPTRAPVVLSPTERPTSAPVVPPTERPTSRPSVALVVPPTAFPTRSPVVSPTALPPTDAPVDPPTDQPTGAPTQRPTRAPTKSPTKAPTKAPTRRPTPRPTDSPTGAPVVSGITMEELSQHDSEDDCWAAYLGNVYDLTDFVSKHKGGPAFITQACGKDDTDAFLAFHKEKELKKVEDDLLGPLI